MDAEPEAEACEIARRERPENEVSPTFHARDVFAPVATLLAKGAALAEIGPPARDPIGLSLPEMASAAEDGWMATVIHVDRFGNLVTNVTSKHLERIGVDARRGVGLSAFVCGRELPLIRTYADVRDGEAAVLLGGGGRLEAAVRRGSAARRFGLGKGDVFHLRPAPSGDQ